MLAHLSRHNTEREVYRGGDFAAPIFSRKEQQGDSKNPQNLRLFSGKISSIPKIPIDKWCLGAYDNYNQDHVAWFAVPCS